MKTTGLDEKERIKLELDRDEMRKQEEEWRRKEKEVEERERLQPWNVDTIGKEKWSKWVFLGGGGNLKISEKTEIFNYFLRIQGIAFFRVRTYNFPAVVSPPEPI